MDYNHRNTSIIISTVARKWQTLTGTKIPLGNHSIFDFFIVSYNQPKKNARFEPRSAKDEYRKFKGGAHFPDPDG